MKTVLCCGCFDLLHYGHVLHLKAARELGDRLIVALTGDRFISKGNGRPVFNQDQRAEMLRALRCVNEVIIYQDVRPDEVIKRLKPDIYCKDQEYRGCLPEQHLVESLGGKVVFTNTQKFSSTELIGKICGYSARADVVTKARY